MKKLWKRVGAGLLTVFLLAGTAAAAVKPLAEEKPEGKTTLMIYMIGSDLESKMGAATEDMKEMAESGVDMTAADIVICAGGTSKWQGDLGDTESLSLLHLTDKGFEQEGTLPLQSMGEPDCLAAFVNEAVKSHPADRYALIFWDHGNGPVMGYGKDLLFDKDALTLPEMKEAMDKTPFAGDLKLDWVGFDACLMASAELACVWRDYAGFLVSSQEVEPGFGWYYAFLQDFGRLPAEELTRSIADNYLAFTEEKAAERENYNPEATLSVMDLSAADRLEEAVNALFKKAAGDVSGDYSRLASARVNTRAIGRASTGSEYDLVDLQRAAIELAEDYPKENAALLQALEDLVVYNVSNTPECCGVSLYYPYYNKSYYKKTWSDAYRTLGLFPDYLTYLERYDKVWLGTDMQEYFEGTMEVSEGAAPSTYTLQLTEEQAAVYAKSNYYILRRDAEDLYSVIYCSWDVEEKKGKLTAEFDGNILYFETDFGFKGIPFTLMYDTVDGMTDYKAMNMVLTKGESYGSGDDALETEIRFSANRQTGEMVIKGVFPVEAGEEEFSGGKQEPVDLSDWDVIRFYKMTPHYLSRDEDGSVKYYWDWPEQESVLWQEVPLADNPTFRFEPLYDNGEEYFLIINVMDVQGNLYSSELFPIVPAAAPAEGSRPETDFVSWDEGDEVTLLETEGVKVSLTAARDSSTGYPLYFLKGENSNDWPVIVSAGGEGAAVNGKISGENLHAWLNLEAGQTKMAALSGVTRDLIRSGENTAAALEFPCKIVRRDNDATLYKGNPGVRLSEALDFPVRWTAALSARAEEQILLEADGVTVSLLGLGLPMDSNFTGETATYDEVKAAFSAENNSGSEAVVEITGMVANGIYIGTDLTGRLPDKTTWYCSARETVENIMAMGDTFREIKDPETGDAVWVTAEAELQRLIEAQPEGGLPWITGITTLSVVIGINDRYYTRPVTLSEQGDQAPFDFDKEAVYQDETLEIRMYSVEEGQNYYGEDVVTRSFWIINRGDNVMNLYCYPADTDLSDDSAFMDYYDTCDVGPESAVLMTVETGREEGPELALKLVDYTYGSEYETKPFVLKSE